ncbi:ABC transporter substrate-binding protein [Oerskovia turbata]
MAGAVLVSLGVALTACSTGDGAAAGDGPVEITYATWSEDQRPAMEKIAEAYESDHPGVDIKVQALPWTEFWSTMQVGAQGGTAPDVFWMLPAQFPTYAAGGMLLELDDAVDAAGVDMSVYPEKVLDLYDDFGHVYGLPKDYDTNAIWYNKDLFDAAGIAYPDDTWTWETYREVAKSLTDPAAGVWGTAAPLEAQSAYYNTILQAGGTLLNDAGTAVELDTPEAIAGFSFWTDLLADGSSPTLKQMSDTEPVSMFQSGKIGMYISGSYWAARFAGDESSRDFVAAAPMPKGVERGTVTSGLLNVGYAGTEHPDEVKDFLIFLGGEEAARIQGEAGIVIPAYAGTEQTFVDWMPEFDLQVFVDAAEYATPMPVTANTAEWEGLAGGILAPAWEGAVPVADAAAELTTAINAVLEPTDG